MTNGFVVREREPLARHTALRTGGPCAAYLLVHRREALPEALGLCRERGWSWTVLGAGTRTVVRDGGLGGAVLRLGTDFAGIRLEEGRAHLGAAAPVAAAAEVVARAGLRGLEGLAAIPGSVGASVRLDPGWDAVEHVLVWRRGRERAVPPESLATLGGSSVVLEVTVRLVGDAPHRIRERMARAWAGPSPWSWYEAPRQLDPRPLLLRVGLGDVRLRDVAIPDAAPEMLVNLGRGSARDLQVLHRSALERVASLRGVTLASRVRWIGAGTGREA